MLGTARLAEGGVALPGSLRGRAALALLDRAFELGIRALDTAAIYQFGGSERLIGAWLRSAGIRDRIYLIGKGGHPSLLWRPRLGRRDLERDLDGSLLRLGTDRLDLYLLHRDAAGAPLEPIAEPLWSFVADGRIRAYGVSNWTHERFAALHALALRRGMPAPAASSPQFSLPVWVRRPYPGCVSIGGPVAAAALDAYRAARAAVLAWSPLGAGWLRTAGRRARGRAYRGGDNDARLRRLTALAARIGCTAGAGGAGLRAGARSPRPRDRRHAPAATAGGAAGGSAVRLSERELAWLRSGAAGDAGDAAPVGAEVPP